MIKKIKNLVAVSALASAMLIGSATSAFAHQGHTSCKGFGEGLVAEFAQTEGGVGQVVHTITPLNDDVESEHPIFCEAK